MPSSDLRKKLAATKSNSFRLRAKELAHGVHSGGHRADRKGSGVEFASHREYVPGDDLRRLDRHALLRHGRLLIREFRTDTERAVHLVVDVTRSMDFAGSQIESERGMGETKGARALLLAAALGFIAQKAGDAVGLTLLGGGRTETFPPRGGREAFEQVILRLQKVDGDLEAYSNPGSPAPWKTTLDSLGGRLPRGSIIFVFSDFLDFTPETNRALASLCTRGRSVRAAQILTSAEVEFPFSGPVRLQAMEDTQQIETDAASVRQEYQNALERLTLDIRQSLNALGGSFVRSVTESKLDTSLLLLSLGQESNDSMIDKGMS